MSGAATGHDDSLAELPAAYARWRRSRLGRVTDALERDLILELAGPLGGSSVLDVGCGDGDLATAYWRGDADVVAMDLDPRMLALARRRLIAEGGAASLVRARVESLPFASGTFDLVSAIAVLCFVPDAPKAVAEMARVLKPGGRLVLGELGRHNLWAALRRIRGWLGSPTWKAARFRDAAELRELVERAGLSATSARGAVFYPPLGWAARALARADPWLGRRATCGAAFVAIAAAKPIATGKAADTAPAGREAMMRRVVEGGQTPKAVREAEGEGWWSRGGSNP